MTGTVTRAVLLIAAITLGGVVVFYGILSDEPLPDRRWLHGKNDLALHALAFFALSLPLLALWPRLMTVIALTGLATAVEVAQFWLPRRNPGSFRFHHVSTDEVFGSLPADKSVMFTEDTAYDPRSPYSATKASSDHLVRAWGETYGLPVVLSNCSNNYGPYHFPEKLIPVVILNALADKPLPIYGDGSNIRDWLYVEDHADALLLVAQQGEIGRSYNIGGENECTNLQLVKTICAILDRLRPREASSYADLINFVTDRPGHDARYAIDPSRIRGELGWRPSVTVEEGLERTVRWYLENEDWWRPLLTRQGVGQRLGTAQKAAS